MNPGAATDTNAAVVTVTDAAAARLRRLLSHAGLADGGLRVVVQSAGCEGFAVVMDLTAEPLPGDVELASNGVRLFADVASVLSLPGAVLDYTTDQGGSEFRWRHPASEQGCVCADPTTQEAG